MSESGTAPEVSSGPGEPEGGWAPPSTWDELARLPHRRDWLELRRAFAESVCAGFADWITPEQAHFREQLGYALGRFDEGAELARYFGRSRRSLRLLDVGAGNGGVAVALANCSDFRVHTLDLVPNPNLRRLRRTLDLPLEPVVGTGHEIPFAAETFDAVLLLDMLEHVARPAELAREVMRVLRPGGVCMITTLARLKYLFARDPHYGIRGLLLFPNAVQRQIVNRVFRRRVGIPGRSETPAYDVEQIFWSVESIARLFPGSRHAEALYNRVLNGSARRFTRGWWQYTFRHLLWDRVLVYKEE